MMYKSMLVAAVSFSGVCAFGDGANLNLAMVHRWSFTTGAPLVDSVGGNTADFAGSVTFADNMATLAGGSNGASWISLGGDVLPKDGSPVTIEIWAKQNAVKNWGRIFDIHGGDKNNDFYMSWSNALNGNGDQIELKTSGTVRWQITNRFAPYTTGTEYLIVATLEPNFGGTGYTRYTFRKVDLATGTILKTEYKEIADSIGSPAKILQSNFWLGHSVYNDNDAAATYNEVRVLKTALSNAQLTLDAVCGPDAWPYVAMVGDLNYVSVTRALAAATSAGVLTVIGNDKGQLLPVGTTFSGAITFTANSKLYFDPAGVTEGTTTLLTAAGGITLPSGGNIADYVGFPDEWHNTLISVSLAENNTQVRYGVDPVMFQTAATLNGRGYFTVDEALAASSAADTVTVRRAFADAHPVTIYKTTPGAIVLESGAKLFIDMEGFSEEAVLTAAGGITLPAGTTAADVVEFSDPAFMPQLSDDGKSIRAVSLTIPVSATWTGAGSTVVVTDSANWQCLNAFGDVIPEAIPNPTYTRVMVSGEALFSVSTAGDVIWKSLSIGSCSLTNDCDWTGLGSEYELTGTVDLQGHNLTIAGFPSGTGGFTDTAATGGELHVSVPANATLTNAAIPLTGSLALVKDGAGVFTASKTGQTYTGGTRITGGTIRLGASTSQGTLGAGDTDIQVDQGGFLDANSKWGNTNHTIVLNGGTLGNKNTFKNDDYRYTHFGNVRLTADSSMSFTVGGLVGKDFNRVTLDLQGHTLTWYGNDDWCWMNNVTMTAGKVVVTGRLTVFYNATYPYGIDASATTIEMSKSAILNIDRLPFLMGDYICESEKDQTDNTGTIAVSRSFKPVTDWFWGCQLKDGATLDLSTRTAPFALRSSDTTGGAMPKDVTFADNATITVDIGDRWVASGAQIVKWTTPPANLAGLKFKLKQNTGHGHILVKSDGLYVLRGTMIFIT